MMSGCPEINEQGILWFKGGNFEKAKQCWEYAAKEGNASAMFCMGILCLTTRYYNLPMAEIWFKKADAAGHKNAKYQLEHLVEGTTRTDMADMIFCQPISVYDNIKWKETKFGNYEWFIIGEFQNKELYISKYIIDIRKYHDFLMPNISWETSDIRKWLNSEFLKEFSDDERNLICDTYNLNKGNPKYNNGNEKTTLDKCFLLSYDEVLEFMLENKKLCDSADLLSNKSNLTQLVAVVNMNPYKIQEAQVRAGLDYSMVNGQSIGWWLRTQGENCTRAMRVNCNGAIRLHGREICRNLVGVRPAMWITKHG